MLSINDVMFTDQMILNGGKFILVQLMPIYDETQNEDEERTRIGTKMIAALTAHKLNKIEVMIEDIVVCSSFNDLQLAEVTFSDFLGSFIQNESEEYTFQATASRFRLVNESLL